MFNFKSPGISQLADIVFDGLINFPASVDIIYIPGLPGRPADRRFRVQKLHGKVKGICAQKKNNGFYRRSFLRLGPSSGQGDRVYLLQFSDEPPVFLDSRSITFSERCLFAMLSTGKKPAGKWLTGLLCLTLSILIILGVAAYIVDPYFAYRFRDGTYFISSEFALPGIIKNADYDAAVLGSSMIQNFDMRSFRDKLGCNAVKLSNGGISQTEIGQLYTLLQEQGKAQSYYICLDLYLFSYHQYEDKDRTPHYLSDDNVFNDYRYLLGYATWMRFIPVDLAYMTLDRLNISLPEKLSRSKKLDYLEDWSLEAAVGRDAVIGDYQAGTHNVSDIDLDDLYGRMINRADTFVQSLDFSEGDYTFFFPPLFRPVLVYRRVPRVFRYVSGRQIIPDRGFGG